MTGGPGTAPLHATPSPNWRLHGGAFAAAGVQRLRERPPHSEAARGAAAVSGGRRLSTAPTARAEAGIELICGPMFSGKTTALLARVASEEAAGHKVRNPPFSSTGNDY